MKHDGVTLLSTLYNTGEVRVAEFLIAPESVGSVHYHTTVNELCICLEGEMIVHQKDLPVITLTPGQRTTILPGVVHTVENRLTTPCKYMVVQGPGKYDLVRMAMDAH
jgi:mannose-6-phosphate isomerase-like protein (cupin superfamily)